MIDITKLISGEDRRSLEGVEIVVELIKDEPQLAGYLLESIRPEEPAYNMRALDAVEKASRENCDLLFPYKDIFIKDLLNQSQNEIRWHVAQIIPRFQLTLSEVRHITDVFISEYLESKSSIVKTNTLQALVRLAMKHKGLVTVVKPILEEAIKAGTPAMKVRSRKLILELDGNFE